MMIIWPCSFLSRSRRVIRWILTQRSTGEFDGGPLIFCKDIFFLLLGGRTYCPPPMLTSMPTVYQFLSITMFFFFSFSAKWKIPTKENYGQCEDCHIHRLMNTLRSLAILSVHLCVSRVNSHRPLLLASQPSIYMKHLHRAVQNGTCFRMF